MVHTQAALRYAQHVAAATPAVEASADATTALEETDLDLVLQAGTQHVVSTSPSAMLSYPGQAIEEAVDAMRHGERKVCPDRGGPLMPPMRADSADSHPTSGVGQDWSLLFMIPRSVVQRMRAGQPANGLQQDPTVTLCVLAVLCASSALLISGSFRSASTPPADIPVLCSSMPCRSAQSGSCAHCCASLPFACGRAF